MSRQFAIRKTCDELGFVDDLSVDDNNNDDDLVFITVEHGENNEEIGVDYECDEDVNFDPGDEEGRTLDGISNKRGTTYTNKKLLNERQR